jgi:hypothetical protein
MLLDRLSREEFLSVNFKTYYTYALHGSSGAHDVRFSLSASSIDRVYTVMRDSNYQSPGINTRVYTGAQLSDLNCSNALMFLSFNSSVTARGDLRFQYSVNNVQHPQYRADCLDAVHSLSEICPTSNGNMICSLEDWNIGKAIIPMTLSMNDQPVNVMSGYNSRGNNTQFSISLTGLDIPAAADVTEQTSATISTLVVVETTSQLRISGGCQISVSY